MLHHRHQHNPKTKVQIKYRFFKYFKWTTFAKTTNIEMIYIILEVFQNVHKITIYVKGKVKWNCNDQSQQDK